MIAWPFGLFDCCPTTDGAAAAIVCRADLARGRRKAPVMVKSAALAVSTGVVPPTVGLVPPARAGLDVVTGAARLGRVRVAAVDGLARGGLCRALRLEAV